MYLIEAKLIRLSGRKSKVPGWLDRGISYYIRTLGQKRDS